MRCNTAWPDDGIIGMSVATIIAHFPGNDCRLVGSTRIYAGNMGNQNGIIVEFINSLQNCLFFQFQIRRERYDICAGDGRDPDSF